jgi:hypothetical protein
MTIPVNLAVSSLEISIKEKELQIEQSDGEFTELSLSNRRYDGESPKT